MNAHDGGPAFPINDLSVSNATGEAIQHQYVEPGMSLRDYFAGQALAGIMAEHVGQERAEFYARLAYVVADCMLRERSKS